MVPLLTRSWYIEQGKILAPAQSCGGGRGLTYLLTYLPSTPTPIPLGGTVVTRHGIHTPLSLYVLRILLRYCESCWLEYYGERPQDDSNALVAVEASKKLEGAFKALGLTGHSFYIILLGISIKEIDVDGVSAFAWHEADVQGFDSWSEEVLAEAWAETILPGWPPMSKTETLQVEDAQGTRFGWTK